MNPFLHGVLMALPIALSVSPGFVALFQTSIVRGVNAGMVLVTGILISDLILISISYLGLSHLTVKGHSLTLGIIAGLILITSGTISIFRKPSTPLNSAKNTSDLHGRLSVILVRGFLVNIANPFVLIFWLGVMGFAASNYGMHSYGFFVFFLGLILTSFSSDLMKCYLSGHFKKILTIRTIAILNKVMGVIFIAIGIFIICKVMI